MESNARAGTVNAPATETIATNPLPGLARVQEDDAGLPLGAPVPAPNPAQQKDTAAPGRVITGLAEMPENALLDETALARVFNVTPRTIRRMVSRFELPPPIRMAGHSTWISGGVMAHLNERAAQAARKAMQTALRIGLTGHPRL